MNDYKKLEVWKLSIDLVCDIYSLAGSFPEDEKFGLKSQLKRSAISIPSNIAEGAGRNNKNEFIHFLGIANGSCCELETQLIIAEKLNLLKTDQPEQTFNKINSIKRMNTNLIKSLR